MKKKANIIGIGKSIPKQKITNQYFVDLGLDTSDQWIKDRTGIQERYFCKENEGSSDLAYQACINAINNASIEAKEIEPIIVATTPDYLAFPSTACLLQKIKLKNIMAFDLSAACSGFSYALNVAINLLLQQPMKQYLLLV